MVQAASPRQGFHSRAVIRLRFGQPAKRRVLVERKVSAIFMVVGNVFAGDPPHVRLVERDDVIEALTTRTADKPLRYSALPGTPEARALGLDAGRLQQIPYFGAELVSRSKMAY